ncbi:MAG: VOC family protein [Alphaproteobacteria bacterium]|nr:VOC family protein [Alphaproteobacteria bacterium]
MIPNRSMPDAAVVPELVYRDLGAAIRWLCDAFGFSLRLRIANHRAQLDAGAGAVVLVAGEPCDPPPGGRAAGVMVRVEDVDRHCAQSRRSGAEIVRPPADYPYGERQYACRDLGNYVWTFSQTIADVAPEAWGASRPGGERLI